MNMGKKILVGAGMAVFVTAASFVTPGGMLSPQDSGSNEPAGVGRTTPSMSGTPFSSTGTVPVVTPSAKAKPKSSVSPSGAPKKAQLEKTRKSVESAPKASPSAVRATPRVSATSAARKNAPTSKPPKVTTIGGYAFCGGSAGAAQKCIDQGKLTLYYPSGVNTLAGHNYMGWSWIDDLPVGRIVKITSGGLAGTYKVYGHAKVYNKQFPSSGLGADVALQTCEDSGIGFSFLRRI